MKKSMFVSAGLLISLAAGAQKLKESDVPKAVSDNFKKSYPEVKKVEWEKEGANFEAEFEIAKVEQSVVYDASGNAIETEIEIPTTELPAAVNEYLNKNYQGVKIKEATKISEPNGNVSYEVEIKDKDLIFDDKGAFIKEVAKSKEDKD